jgi:hypothetical protein
LIRPFWRRGRGACERNGRLINAFVSVLSFSVKNAIICQDRLLGTNTTKLTTNAQQCLHTIAHHRGVLFDVGHGGGSFHWPVAEIAAAEGFWPDTISTDLHRFDRKKGKEKTKENETLFSCLAPCCLDRRSFAKTDSGQNTRNTPKIKQSGVRACVRACRRPQRLQGRTGVRPAYSFDEVAHNRNASN